MDVITYSRFWMRGDTQANWASANPVLHAREIGVVTDSAAPLAFKIGDGITAWNSLPYQTAPFAVAAGADTITATFNPKPFLFDGFHVHVRAAAANTGAATFNPNGLGAHAITKFGGTALSAGDIFGAGHELILRYVSSVPRWELLNPAATGGGGSTPSGTGWVHVTAGVQDGAASTPTASDVGAQSADSDLSAIAALTPTNDDIIQRKAGAWTNRTMAQLTADLTFGTAVSTVCQGNDSRLSDARTPVGTALTSTNLWVGSAGNIAAAVVLSGDATLGNTGALTLATVNSNVGAFGSATQVATFTVNAKGLTTAAGNTTIAIASTAVTDFNEAAQDAIGLMVDSTLTYTDATPALGVSATNNPVGKHGVPINSGSMAPSFTGGCASLTKIATAANQPDIITLDFDHTTQEYAQFEIESDSSWNAGTLTFVVVWSHASTSTNFKTAWTLEAVSIGDNEAIGTNYGTAVQVNDTGGTTNKRYKTPVSGALTVASSPTAGDTICFRVSRLGNVVDATNDTLAIDARLHRVIVYWTTNAATDA